MLMPSMEVETRKQQGKKPYRFLQFTDYRELVWTAGKLVSDVPDCSESTAKVGGTISAALAATWELPNTIKINRMRILVTDDQPDLQPVLLDYLQAQGFQTDTADSIASMNEKLHQSQYQALLVDLNLPDRDGIQYLSELRKEFGLSLAIVIVSARGQPQQRTQAMQLGADAYLVKPVYLPELLALLQQLQQRLQPPTREQWQLDPGRNYLLSPQGIVIALSQSEARILAALQLRQQSKEMLLKLLAPYLINVQDFGRLDTLICRLRQKVQLLSGEALPLQTIRNKGYLLLDTELRL